MAEFNLNNIMLKVFGLTGRYFISGPSQKVDIKIPDAIPLLEEDEIKGYSLMGTPVYDILEVSYSRKVDKAYIPESYTFEDPALIETNQRKIIVKTPIAGRNGTVKERISMGDVDITIRGLLVNHDSNRYPIEKVNALRAVFKHNDELKAVSRFLNAQDVVSMVIEEISFPELEGFQNVQPYVIKAISDEAIELKIINK